MNEIKYSDEERAQLRAKAKRAEQNRKERARAEGKPNPKRQKERRRQARLQAEAKQARWDAAHFNPDPLPVPIRETRIERTVNDQRRSNGGVIRIESGDGK